MTEYKHPVEVVIVVSRCHDCNRYYGHEKFREERCPHCAKDVTNRLLGTIDKLEKSNRALRGAMTRKAGTK